MIIPLWPCRDQPARVADRDDLVAERHSGRLRSAVNRIDLAASIRRSIPLAVARRAPSPIPCGLMPEPAPSSVRPLRPFAASRSGLHRSPRAPGPARRDRARGVDRHPVAAKQVPDAAAFPDRRVRMHDPAAPVRQAVGTGTRGGRARAWPGRPSAPRAAANPATSAAVTGAMLIRDAGPSVRASRAPDELHAARLPRMPLPAAASRTDADRKQVRPLTYPKRAPNTWGSCREAAAIRIRRGSVLIDGGSFPNRLPQVVERRFCDGLEAVDKSSPRTVCSLRQGPSPSRFGEARSRAETRSSLGSQVRLTWWGMPSHEA